MRSTRRWPRNEQGRVVDVSRALSRRKIQFYKNIGLVMRNSRWVSAVAGKNLKRAEEGPGSRSPLPYIQAPLRPTPSVPERKINPAIRPSRFVLSRRFHLRILSSSSHVSLLSPQREFLQNKERSFHSLSDDGDRYTSIFNYDSISFDTLFFINLEFITIRCES